MGKIRVSCPFCDGLFEVDEEFRNEEVDCPKCAKPFEIPATGGRGIPVSEEEEYDEDGMEMACPHCDTAFVLPEEYRGELAECVECKELFYIPREGNVGEPIGDEEEEEPAPAQRGRRTAAGIKVEAPQSPLKKTATVVLSRDEVLADGPDAEKGKDGGSKKPARQVSRPKRLKPSIPIKRVTDDGEEEEDEEEGEEEDGPATVVSTPESGLGQLSELERLDAHAKAIAALAEPPDEAAEQVPVVDINQAGKRSADLSGTVGEEEWVGTLPAWVPPLDLARQEKIVYVEEGADPPVFWHYVFTGVPVFAAPAAAVLAARFTDVHPAIWASVSFLLSMICWGIYLARLMPRLSRRVLILTNQRAIMADPSEVVEIDLQ